MIVAARRRLGPSLLVTAVLAGFLGGVGLSAFALRRRRTA